MENISIPDSVNNISGYALSACRQLDNVIIPDGVTVIDNMLFEYSGITKITIPMSVTTISVDAFHYCSKLTDITYNGTVEQWKKVNKGSRWDESTGKYTVHCVDGDIDKQ